MHVYLYLALVATGTVCLLVLVAAQRADRRAARAGQRPHLVEQRDRRQTESRDDPAAADLAAGEGSRELNEFAEMAEYGIYGGPVK